MEEISPSAKVYTSARVTSVSPNEFCRTSVGEVIVYGTGFRNTNNLGCVFGENTLTAARFINSTAVQCNRPFFQRERIVRVAVTNGEAYEKSRVLVGICDCCDLEQKLNEHENGEHHNEIGEHHNEIVKRSHKKNKHKIIVHHNHTLHTGNTVNNNNENNLNEHNHKEQQQVTANCLTRFLARRRAHLMSLPPRPVMGAQ